MSRPFAKIPRQKDKFRQKNEQNFLHSANVPSESYQLAQDTQEIHSEAHSAHLVTGDYLRAEDLVSVQRDKKFPKELPFLYRRFQLFHERVFIFHAPRAPLFDYAVPDGLYHRPHLGDLPALHRYRQQSAAVLLRSEPLEPAEPVVQKFLRLVEALRVLAAAQHHRYQPHVPALRARRKAAARAVRCAGLSAQYAIVVSHQLVGVQTMHCAGCGTKIEGDFVLPELMRLSEENQQFVLDFVRCSGSLKEMAQKLGLSYPTVRNRLDEVISQLE